ATACGKRSLTATASPCSDASTAAQLTTRSKPATSGTSRAASKAIPPGGGVRAAPTTSTSAEARQTSRPRMPVAPMTRTLRTGTRAAAERGLDYVVFMDSDLTNDPRYLQAFAARMAEGVDVIKASRYVAGGGAVGVPTWRRALSVLGNAVARLLFRLPVTD